MKEIITTHDDVITRTIIVVLLFYVVTSFLLTLVRMLLNHRLKSKMISMGIVGADAEKMLGNNTAKDYAVKWCILLLSAGFACTLISYIPFGWLSVAILAFSLAIGFAAYYYYLQTKPK